MRRRVVQREKANSYNRAKKQRFFDQVDAHLAFSLIRLDRAASFAAIFVVVDIDRQPEL
jgi:hypothetical protein